MQNSLNWHEYVGVAHIHSTDSDGSKSVPEIISIGEELGLDFLLFSDHMSLNSFHLGLEGWHGKTYVLIGYEMHDQDNINHYLAFDVNEILPGEMTTKEYVKAVADKGGLGIIAHPDETRNIPGYPPLPWTAWDAVGFDGIEIWNQMSEWMEGLNRLNQLKMFVSPRRILTSPTPKTLKIWDQLNKKGKVCGISGVDVHAFPYKLGPFTFVIFPYKVQFKSLRMHLLLRDRLSSDNRKAKGQIIGAIKNCQVFISNHRRGDARGFLYYAQNENQIAGIGESLSISGGVSLMVRTPERCKIRLVRDGNLVAENMGKDLEYSSDHKGNYRAEAHIGKRGWIYSNHIRIV